MTLKTANNKENLRLIKSSDYWWDIILGGLITCMIIIPMGAIFLKNMNLSFWIYPYAGLCVVIVVYYQWSDDNLTVIKTGLSKAQNLKLVAMSLDSLNWQYNNTQSRVDLILNKYILEFLDPTIILMSENIYVNFKYQSLSKTGRFPFFFGISTYLEWRFKRAIKKSLLQTIHIELNNNK